jgi:transposase
VREEIIRDRGSKGGYVLDARITFDKFHVITHASAAVDKTRRIEQKTDPTLKGVRWALLKDPTRLDSMSRQRADLDGLVAQLTTKRTARAWLYRAIARLTLLTAAASCSPASWCSHTRMIFHPPASMLN